jgi:hypothetical protein
MRMPTLEFNNEDLPPTETFLELLRTADEQYDPVEELLSLERELVALEQKHNLTSEDFYCQYQAGQTEDTVELIGWAGRYRLYLNLKSAISNSLKLVIMNQAAHPA